MGQNQTLTIKTDDSHEDNLLTVRDVLKAIPVSYNTLQRYLKLRRAKSGVCSKLLFTPAQLQEMKEDFACHLVPLPKPIEKTGRSVDDVMRKIRLMETKRIMNSIRGGLH